MTEPSISPPQCGQCGKPAVVLWGDNPLCVDHHYKMKQMQWMEFAQNVTLANMVEKDLALVTGMPHLSNEIKIPPAPIPPLHYNNQVVTVNGGNVGAINFGNVHEIQVSLGSLTQGGEVGVADAMANLTNAILNSNEIAEAGKNELLEQIAFLTSQASAPPAERKPSMIRTILSTMKDGAAAIGGIAGAWDAVEPLLHGHFGL